MNAASRFIIALFLIVMCWAHTVGGGEKTTLTISAAMSLKNAFEEIESAFEKEYHFVMVHLNLGASGDLARQIVAGAPVDIFASASQRDMDGLENNNLLQEDTRIDFTGNAMVLIQPVRSVAAISLFEDPTRPNMRRIAIGNPQTVPAGRRSSCVGQTFSPKSYLHACRM